MASPSLLNGLLVISVVPLRHSSCLCSPSAGQQHNRISHQQFTGATFVSVQPIVALTMAQNFRSMVLAHTQGGTRPKLTNLPPCIQMWPHEVINCKRSKGTATKAEEKGGGTGVVSPLYLQRLHLSATLPQIALPGDAMPMTARPKCTVPGHFSNPDTIPKSKTAVNYKPQGHGRLLPHKYRGICTLAMKASVIYRGLRAPTGRLVRQRASSQRIASSTAGAPVLHVYSLEQRRRSHSSPKKASSNNVGSHGHPSSGDFSPSQCHREYAPLSMLPVSMILLSLCTSTVSSSSLLPLSLRFLASLAHSRNPLLSPDHTPSCGTCSRSRCTRNFVQRERI